jgi:hypothetical protein
MTREELLRWLEARRPAPPAELRAHLESAVTGVELALPEHLAELGRRVLARVADQPSGERELALELLTADALVTYAFEAQAEADPAGLTSLAARIAGAER